MVLERRLWKCLTQIMLTRMWDCSYEMMPLAHSCVTSITTPWLCYAITQYAATPMNITAKLKECFWCPTTWFSSKLFLRQVWIWRNIFNHIHIHTWQFLSILFHHLRWPLATPPSHRTCHAPDVPHHHTRHFPVRTVLSVQEALLQTKQEQWKYDAQN